MTTKGIRLTKSSGKWFILIAALFLEHAAKAQSDEILRLQRAYPGCIKEVSSYYITWKDGTRMPIRSRFSFLDQWGHLFLGLDYSKGSISKEDIQHDSYEPFFRKMYGNTASEVKKKLVTIYWMPHVFGKRYPLRVTTINNIHQKIERISAALEKFPISYQKYVKNPAGGFYWRNVARENYLSSHSFGIAIDINSSYGNYWLWDLKKSNKPWQRLVVHNRIPSEIVKLFEKEGFFWGGRWYYYDTMHFEYRPELLLRG